jgi:hypothetical protein
MEEDRKGCVMGSFDLDMFSGAGDSIRLQRGNGL